MRRRLLSAPVARAQLRMRVLADVVAVTFAALAAIDLIAVTAMRHYLNGQVQGQLGAAAEQAHQALSALSLASGTGHPPPGISHFARGLASELDIVWLPAGGKPLAIQVAWSSTEGPGGSSTPMVTDAIARTVTREGYYTVSVAGQKTLLTALRYSGPDGLVVAGTTLTQVSSTLARVELIPPRSPR